MLHVKTNVKSELSKIVLCPTLHLTHNLAFPIMLIFGPVMLFFYAAFSINYASKSIIEYYASNIINYSHI